MRSKLITIITKGTKIFIVLIRTKKPNKPTLSKIKLIYCVRESKREILKFGISGSKAKMKSKRNLARFNKISISII